MKSNPVPLYCPCEIPFYYKEYQDVSAISAESTTAQSLSQRIVMPCSFTKLFIAHFIKHFVICDNRYRMLSSVTKSMTTNKQTDEELSNPQELSGLISNHPTFVQIPLREVHPILSIIFLRNNFT